VTPSRILIIAGSDSGGGAGIQADIKAVTMFGGHAMTAITAITAQNTHAVSAIHPIPTEMVLEQIDMVADDIGIDAVKIGMIGSPETASAVAERLSRMDNVPVIFDPVMVASSGAELANAATIVAFRKLLAISRIITPNTPELEVLSGREIQTVEDAEDAALTLCRDTGVAVLAKGGHIRGSEITDTLIEPGGKITRWQSRRVETLSTHGTGCTLASGIAAGVGQGRALSDAVERARHYVQRAISNAPGFGTGNGPIGHALGTMPLEVIHKLLK